MELRKIKINKKEGFKFKNSFEDFTSLFFALAVIFGAAIFFIILSFAYGEMKPKLKEGLSNAATPETAINSTKLLDDTSSSILTFNVLFPLLLVGVVGFVMVTALFGQSHPVFLFIGLIVLGVAIILAVVYSNVYEELTGKSQFTSADSDFNIMGLFLDNLPIIILILFVVIGVILYVKQGGSTQYT
jgi:hypothetical protein